MPAMNSMPSPTAPSLPPGVLAATTPPCRILLVENNAVNRTIATKLLEKLTRRSMRSSRSYFDTYLDRHNRSNRKKKDGWLKDMAENVAKAGKKGRKRFKLSSLF